MSSYHNTTGITGQTLIDFREAAARQDERVCEILRDLGSASPSRIWIAMDRSCPITSVRRALTGLTKAGKARKLEAKVTGEWGRPEHVWTVIEQAA